MKETGGNQKKDISETIYIGKRRAEALLHSFVYYLCRVFPIDKQKIVMWIFECGGGYGCSPKYVAEEILKRNREGKTGYKIVWLLNDMEKEFPKEIKKVKNTLWNRAYHLLPVHGSAIPGLFMGQKREKASIISRHGTQPSVSNLLENTGRDVCPKWRTW